MIDLTRIGGDDPAAGRAAVEAVERWQRERRERRVTYWVRRLMAPPDNDEKPKEQQ